MGAENHEEGNKAADTTVPIYVTPKTRPRVVTEARDDQGHLHPRLDSFEGFCKGVTCCLVCQVGTPRRLLGNMDLIRSSNQSFGGVWAGSNLYKPAFGGSPRRSSAAFLRGTPRRGGASTVQNTEYSYGFAINVKFDPTTSFHSHAISYFATCRARSI